MQKRWTWLVLVMSLLALGEVSADSDVNPRENPFFLPQTNLYVGSSSKSVSVNDGSSPAQNEGGINIYGFDIEVNSTRFLNIGASLRVENLKGDATQFSTLLGGFTRFFYLPPFLSNGTFTTGLFTRLEAGVGPTVLALPRGALSGIMVQGGVHIGIEAYFNHWLGVGLSYGQTVEFGKDTLLSQTSTFNQYANATYFAHGSVFLFSLKTTFF